MFQKLCLDGKNNKKGNIYMHFVNELWQHSSVLSQYCFVTVHITNKYSNLNYLSNYLLFCLNQENYDKADLGLTGPTQLRLYVSYLINILLIRKKTQIR